MNPGIFSLFFVLTRLISLAPCTGSGQTIIEKKRVLFQMDEFLGEDPAGPLKFATVGSTLRIELAGQTTVSVPLPSRPHRAFRRNNLVIVALGNDGILFLDVRDPAHPREVLHRVLDRPVDGFVVLGNELLPTSGGQPIEQIVTRVVACPRTAPLASVEPPPSVEPPATCVEPQEADPGPSLLEPRSPAPPRSLLQPAPAGTTELALFTTARTLPRNTHLIEMSIFGVPQAMPEAAISLVGFKSGLTDRLQVGFRTSPDLLFGLTDHEGGLMVVAAIVGVNLKYQLYKSKDSSFSFNYVFPIVELVYSSFNGPNSFTMAGGTSVISLLMSSSEEQYRDFFVRTGFQKRLSPGLTMVLEAGFYEMLPNSDALAFVNAALRIGGDSIYLDLMAGATNYWGFGGVTLGIAY